ncbi:MAG TPA: hypothetical protein VME24_07900 [Alphaproteobacteria bacterium]|nr:hypothetical protein [Alphaproteobacteria bacterium]
MPLLSARCALVCFGLGFFMAGFTTARAQTNYYAAYGTEYAIVGSLPGDQTYPDLALNRNGGYIVWQDNITDPAGLGISAMQINSTLSGSGDIFAVNTPTTNDQQNARVALLKNGGAAFVWQGGPDNIQHIYARFLNASNVWMTTTNVAVSTFTNNFQNSPAVATLANGNVIVVWTSYDQAASNSQEDVYGQLFSTNGTRIGTNFLINVFTTYNQKSPAVAALANGEFVVAWSSEQERVIGVTNSSTNSIEQMIYPSSDIYERLYTNSGTAVNPLTGEILVDQADNPCAAPAIATASDGSYMVTWGANNSLAPTNGWDIFARSFTNSIGGPAIPVNSYNYGDQYNPQISAIGGDYLIVWTSLGQDGSREGVFGQFVHENGALIGNEFRVNTTTVGSQMQPAVASDGAEQFLAVWTSFTFGPNSLDLYAQRYENVGAVLEPMPAPFVWAPFVISNNVYQPEFDVTWAPVQGLTVSNYLVFVDGTQMATVPGACSEWTMTAANGLTPGSAHSFATEYVTSQGFASPISPSTTATNWIGLNWGGIPYEWMAEYFGGYLGGTNYNTRFWPPANSPVATGGPTLLQVFDTGGNPLIPSTWLQTSLAHGVNGMYLSWNTQPGMTYQVQITSDFKNWINFGAPRFESGTNDCIFVGSGGGGYYRVQLMQP